MAILQGARITGSIIATQFIKASSFSGSLTASRLYVQGSVGIGTTSPASLLHLQSSAATTLLRIDSSNTDNDAAILLTDNNNPTGEGLKITYDSSVGDTYFNNIYTASTRAFNFQKGNFGSGTDLLTILNNGNVGIGTSSPAFALDVTGGVGLNTSGTGVSVTIGANNTSDRYLRIRNSNGNFEIGSAGNQHYLYGIGASNYFSIYTNVTERMRITADGVVLIGTTSAYNSSRLLQVKDGLLIGNSLYTFASIDTNSSADLILSSNANPANLGANSNIIFKLGTSGGGGPTERMRIVSDGNVGIGTSTASGLLSLHGTYPQIIANNPTTGSGVVIQLRDNGRDAGFMGHSTTTARLQFGSKGSSTAHMTIGETGNVGIGTTSPVAKLEPYGTGWTSNAAGSGLLRLNGTDNYPTITFAQSSTPKWSMYVGGAGSWIGNGNIGIVSHFGTEDATRVKLTVISGSGNVGIGTTSPTQKLEVAGFVMGGTSSYRTSIGANASGAYIYFGDTSNLYSLGRLGTYNSAFNINSYNGSIVFQINDSEKVRIDTNGNLGIGTTSPYSKLTVSVPATNTISTADSSNTAGLTISGTGNLVRLQFGVGSNTLGPYGGWIQASYDNTGGNNGIEPLLLNPSGGNVGIGTTSPTTKLAVSDGTTVAQVNPSSGVAYFGTVNNYPMALSVNSSEKVRVDTNGNVGIGTSSPSQKLYLVGAQIIENGHTDTRLQLYYPNAIEARKSYLTLWASEPGLSYNSCGIGGNINLSGQYYGRQVTGSSYGVYMRFDTAYGNSEFWSTTASPGSLNGQGTRVFYIDSSGNAIATGGIRSTYADIGSTAGDIYIASNLNRLGQTSVPTVESQNASKAFVINHTGAQPILFGTNGTERMRILSGGNIGIGTSSPGYKLQVNGTALATTVTDGSISLNGGDLLFAADGGGNGFQFDYYNTKMYIGNNAGSTWYMAIQDDGNIGIGTTSPSSKLHIDDVNAPWITISRSGTPTWQLRNNYPNNQYGFSFNNTTAGTVPLFIGAGGNVGIGLDSPAAKLDIASTQGDGIIMRYDTSTAYQAWIRPYWNSGTDTRIDFAINRSANVTPAVIMSVGYGGNVGIGTTAPSYKLDVISGSMRAATGAYSGEIYFGTVDNANLYLKRDNNYDLSLVQNASSGNALYLAGAGNVYLSIDSNNNETDRAFIVQNNSVKSGTELFRVQENGNVGIGSSSPAYKLDVNGSINASTFMYVTYPYGDAYPLQLIGSSFLKANNNYYGLLIRSGDTNFISGRLSLIGGSSKRFEIHGYEETVGYIPTVIPGGNVGIGTTNPSNGTLQVYNASGNTLSLQKSGGGAALMMGSETTNYALLESINGGGVRFYTGNGTLTEKVRIAVDGNVGIGSSSPTVKFDLYNGRMRYYDGTFSQIPNVVSYKLDNNGTGGYAIKTPFLIGTSYEMAIVHVLGYVYGNSTLVDFKVVFYDYGPSNAPINYSMVDNGNDGFVKYLAKDSSGYINICFAGLGSTYYYARFTVNLYTTRYASGDYSAGWTFTQTTSANYGMSTLYDITPALTTTTSAVGIGTTDPTQKLDINGTLRIRTVSAASDANFLTIDASGNVNYRTGGANGTSGTSGANGSPGSPGSSGTTGVSGTSGVNGTSGTSGANGSPGSSGATGTSGSSGSSVGGSPVRAYVYFNGTGTVTINGSNNVTSITDNGVGDYTVNFTTAFVDAYYAVSGTCTLDFTNGTSIYNVGLFVPRQTNAQVAGSCRLACEYINNTLYDCVAVRAMFVRA